MQIFFDESGLFTDYRAGSISVLGALAVPDSSVRSLRRRYARIRPSLPKESGEVKGKLLKARDVNRIVRLLKTREALFEATAIDLGLHSEAGVLAYKQKLVAENREQLPEFPESLRSKVSAAVNYLDTMPAQLFIQALTCKPGHGSRGRTRVS